MGRGFPVSPAGITCGRILDNKRDFTPGLPISAKKELIILTPLMLIWYKLFHSNECDTPHSACVCVFDYPNKNAPLSRRVHFYPERGRLSKRWISATSVGLEWATQPAGRNARYLTSLRRPPLLLRMCFCVCFAHVRTTTRVGVNFE